MDLTPCPELVSECFNSYNFDCNREFHTGHPTKLTQDDSRACRAQLAFFFVYIVFQSQLTSSGSNVAAAVVVR
jgi:hypothetical protein